MLIIITPPHALPDEECIVNKLFESGLHLLHLRKPGADRETLERYIRGIRPRFRERVILHDHFELAEEYGLRGIHLKYNEARTFTGRNRFAHVSVSCHSFEEIDALPFEPNYVFLSPVFDSISKPGYPSAFTPEYLKENLQKRRVPVIALGGITAEKVAECRKMGFRGVALLGHVWEQPSEAVDRFTNILPDEVLSIAGFDQSSGAGVTADIKTFESCRVYGLGTSSSITFQNQNTYLGTKWLTPDEIIRQCDVLFREFNPAYVKIGLIESFNTLEQVVNYLRTALPEVRIIWDPILKASAGFQFHDGENLTQLQDILRKIYLITPNTDELKTLFGNHPDVESLQALARGLNLNILWKGGHNDGALASDRLVTPDKVYTFSVTRARHGKHGTGCVLSSAIASYLTLGYPLPDACRLGQHYVAGFIRSNDTNLGMHNRVESTVPEVDLYRIPLQYITDYKEGVSIPEQVEAVCKGGCRWVQLRMKEADREEFTRVGRTVKEICKRHGALFLVNDNVDIALELDADGVHLGKEDMNPLKARQILGYSKIIGGTCNTFEDVVTRFRQQVDYIGLGPFTYTSTKKRLSPILGLEGYRKIMEACRKEGIYLPIHAIGGIREDDIQPILNTGITGIALSSLLKNSEDITGKTKETMEQLKIKELPPPFGVLPL
ncbi:thiamine phosphate synthase [Butyricimonas virosa]|uniref:thiamine phosphate synthase n=1 Tax=Butyricimonas virosa TaxID=544645 RepID=UPI00242C5E15|nr:thiamine phosphate synthase [Butyricimonas virosa]